jgi:ribosomal protein L7/L12
VLESFKPDRKIIAIAAVRAATGLGLGKVVELVERVPAVILERLLLEDAARLRDDLESGSWSANEFRPAGRLRAGETCCRVSIQPDL